jgi:hypothetical protein
VAMSFLKRLFCGTGAKNPPKRVYGLLVFAGLAILVCGCKSLFPSNTSTTESRWKSYEEASSAFDKIVPHQTDTNRLAQLGFHPSVSPNVKILTYVDLVQIFMPNPAISTQDLPPGVRECIDAREDGLAYAVELNNIHSKRHGNLFLDIFGFKRKTHETGWHFKGLILIKDGVVVYTLSSGEPQISRDDNQVKPLGPFQELDGVFFHIVTFP